MRPRAGFTILEVLIALPFFIPPVISWLISACGDAAITGMPSSVCKTTRPSGMIFGVTWSRTPTVPDSASARQSEANDRSPAL